MGRPYGKMQDEVLAELRRHRKPKSAYALLAKLQRDRPKLGPTSVYRALDALIQKGAVRRLESIKRYVACRQDDDPQDCVVAICDDCGAVEERIAPRLIEDLSAEAGKSGFAVKRHVIELHGHCGACAPGGTQS